MKRIVAGNWKMNKTLPQARALASLMAKGSTKVPANTDLILCPPAPYLHDVVKLVKNTSNIFVGAQNVHTEEFGAYTGEVSAPMLASLGVTFCLVGHSERREDFKETDQFLSKKVDALLKANIRPVFCCGEKLEERSAGKQFEVVKSQLTKGLFHITSKQMRTVIIAYEPVWAIGTGQTATSAQAQEMHSYIRSLVGHKFGLDVSDETPLLYGGSCNPQNAAELFSCKDINGGLIGGASLKFDDFIAIAHT